ncbi:MAG: hypothetical protein H0X49_01355 [Acidobacteria bacterium]|nr:hypothetical protein [Acidobacteriota bacterium]
MREVGEIGITGVAAAIAHAVFNATGSAAWRTGVVRFRRDEIDEKETAVQLNYSIRL